MMTNTVIIEVADYRKLVEDAMLYKLKAESLERRTRELIEQCDSISKRLGVTDELLEKANIAIEKGEEQIRRWRDKYGFLETALEEDERQKEDTAQSPS